MINIEKEYKYQFNYKDYLKLKSYFEINCISERTIYQTNYYIDTKELFLKGLGITIRIREYKGGEVELTIKKLKEKNGKNLHIKTEVNINLNNNIGSEFLSTKQLSKSILKELLVVLSGFPSIELTEIINKLTVLGELETVRTFYELDFFQDPFNLDINSYLSKIDYELELETLEIDKGFEIIKEIFDKLKINPLINTNSKNSRFINSYELKL